MHIEKFFEDNLVLLCHPNHSLSNKKNVKIFDLVNYKFLLREPGSASRDIFESIANLNDIKLNIVWESISNESIIEATKNNYGISVLPKLIINEYLAKGELVEIDTDISALKRNLYLIIHKNKYIGKNLKKFIEMVLEFNSMYSQLFVE